MANLHLRKKSKRQSTKHRVKVEKKVREHNKKQKRQNKKTAHKKAKAKDPGIPQILPFRDEVLKDIELAKQRKEEEIKLRKEARKKAKEKLLNEKRDLTSVMEDAKTKQEAYDRIHDGKGIEEAPLKKVKESKENSRKAFFKEFKKVVDAADVVLEVLDARDPLGSRCAEMEEAVRMSPGNKRLVLVLNKIDLVPKENVEAWLKYLRKELPAVPFKASTQEQKSKLSRSKVSFRKATDVQLKSSPCLGSDILMKLLGNYCRNTDMSINVGVVGFPNTGKSSIINSLKRARACHVGSVPGITRVMQTVMLDKHVKLLDSPGVVMKTSPSETAAVLRNVVRLDAVVDPVPAVEAILSRCQKNQMMTHYKIPSYSNANEFLSFLAARFGNYKKKGIPDIPRAARRLLQDWNKGVINYYTSPPENLHTSHHIEASIVSDWAKEFNIDDVIKAESSVMRGLKSCSDSHFLISPFDPIKGVVTEMGAKDEDDDEDEELEEEDDGIEEEEMEDEDDEEELKGVTINMEASGKENPPINGKDSKDLSYRHKGPQPTSKLEVVGGLITKKSIKMAEKKEKKKKKKASALAGQLSDALTTAFSGLGGDGDSYSFEADFK